MKIVISGGWSYGNLGDEVIAASTIYLINKYFKDVEVVYTSYDVNSFYTNHKIKAIKSVHYHIEKRKGHDFVEVFTHIQDYHLNEFDSLFNSDTLFIMSGGGYFHSQWESQFLSRVLEIEIAKKHNAKVALIGQSMGPFWNNESKTLLINALNKVDFLSVRDYSSKFCIDGLKLQIESHFSPDLAIIISDALDKKEQGPRANLVNIMPASYTSYVEINGTKQNRFLESFRKRLSIEGLRYKREFVKLIKSLLDDEICNINIILSTLWEWDIRFAKYILKSVNNDKIRLITCQTYQDLCRHFSDGSLTISTKMHPLIISTSYGIPTIGIAYNYKVLDYMTLIQNGHGCFRIDDIDADKILEVIKQKELEDPVDISILKEDVYKTFSYLVNLIGKDL